MIHYSGMKWYLFELTVYGIGAGLYTFRIPERFAPGAFDIWLSFHQIFHVSILFAMYLNMLGLKQAFMASHASDICHIKATHG
ncbi:hypothetical protein ACQRIU_001334 [Beauveria bassiana]